MGVHHEVSISCQINSGYRPSRVNIMAQGLSTPDPSLSPTHLSIRRGRATTTHYTHHQVILMVLRNTTLVPSLGLRTGSAYEAGLSAGRKRKKERKKGCGWKRMGWGRGQMGRAWGGDRDGCDGDGMGMGRNLWGWSGHGENKLSPSSSLQLQPHDTYFARPQSFAHFYWKWRDTHHAGRCQSLETVLPVDWLRRG